MGVMDRNRAQLLRGGLAVAGLGLASAAGSSAAVAALRIPRGSASWRAGPRDLGHIRLRASGRGFASTGTSRPRDRDRVPILGGSDDQHPGHGDGAGRSQRRVIVTSGTRATLAAAGKRVRSRSSGASAAIRSGRVGREPGAAGRQRHRADVLLAALTPKRLELLQEVIPSLSRGHPVEPGSGRRLAPGRSRRPPRRSGSNSSAWRCRPRRLPESPSRPPAQSVAEALVVRLIPRVTGRRS